jgi:hypothetical protein
MNITDVRVGWVLCFGVAALGAPTLQAQEAKPPAQSNESRTHLLEIYNGPFRTVHYYGTGDSTGELASLRSNAHAEKQAELADLLLDLRKQYVHDERALQSRRKTVQQQWYGQANEYSFGYDPYWSYPVGYAGYGYSGFTAGGYSGTTYNNLAFGVGDEGAIKSAIARTLANQATPKTAGYGPTAAEGFSVAPPGAHVIVSCKIGDTTEKIDGTLLDENADWIVVKTQAGNRTIPKRQVLEILEPGQAIQAASNN